MKCPLLTVAYNANLKGDAWYNVDCLGEECAWWRGEEEEWGILGLSYQLDALAGALVTVLQKEEG